MPTKKTKIKRPKMTRYTFKDFEKQFPTDDACLEWLRDYLYPNGIFCEPCGKVTKHHKVASRKSYSCQFCGHHVHPTANTIYHKSSTSLKTWFHAIYLMASTRCGISAKQLERETGVTYKTAWRMFKQIRMMLEENHDPFSGKVEADESYFGGKAKNMHKDVRARKIQGRGTVGKTIVAGMLQREGAVVARVISDTEATRSFHLLKRESCLARWSIPMNSRPTTRFPQAAMSTGGCIIRLGYGYVVML